jgi:hypothetical protein
MAELLYFNDEVKEWVENRNLTARDVVQRAVQSGYLIPMKEVAREKVRAGITSEMEVAAVLGLVESRRQYSNAMFESSQPNISQENHTHHEEIIEGEVVG